VGLRRLPRPPDRRLAPLTGPGGWGGVQPSEQPERGRRRLPSPPWRRRRGPP